MPQALIERGTFSRMPRPADPGLDAKRLVAEGYDRCGEAYAGERSSEPAPELVRLTCRLRDGASVLDIGCGAGVPIARALARRFRVTGIDISKEMVLRAQRNVPGAIVLHGDVMAMQFEEASFDGAVCFYALFHLPREEHDELIRRVYRWLVPGGLFLLTVTRFSESGYLEEFFGVMMFWSNWSLDQYRSILAEAGFELLELGEVGHGYEQVAPEHHPLILARKPA